MMRDVGGLYLKEMRENLVTTLLGLVLVALAVTVGLSHLREPWGVFLSSIPLYGLPIWYLVVAYASIHHEWNQHTAYWLLSLPVREESILLAKALALVTQGLLVSLPAAVGWGVILERASEGAFWPDFGYTYLLLYLLVLLAAFTTAGLVFLSALARQAVIPRAGGLVGQLTQGSVVLAGLWLGGRFAGWLAEVLDFLPALPLMGFSSSLGSMGFSLAPMPALPLGTPIAAVLLAVLFLWLAAQTLRRWVEV